MRYSTLPPFKNLLENIQWLQSNKYGFFSHVSIHTETQNWFVVADLKLTLKSWLWLFWARYLEEQHTMDKDLYL